MFILRRITTEVMTLFIQSRSRPYFNLQKPNIQALGDSGNRKLTKTGKNFGDRLGQERETERESLVKSAWS